VFSPADGNIATRQASGRFLENAANKISWFFGGSADLASSNEMTVQATLSFQPGHYEQPHIWFGVREHAMGAMLNGIAAHRGLLAYGGTFLTFSDYMKGAIRLAALSHLPVTYVFTHDSIGLGEDGPTHQPIEQVGALRMIPNLVTIRPGDANETMEAWKFAIARKDGPVALILCRQKIPVTNVDVYAPSSNTVRGGYTIREAGGPINLLFIATGSELFLALEAAELLEKEHIFTRVVSMPSWELFESQSDQYKQDVLPPAIKNRISVEALSPFGWERYVGASGKIIGINRFGESGPGEELLQLFGFTVEALIKHAKDLLEKNKAQREDTIF
jgi:transketolase